MKTKINLIQFTVLLFYSSLSLAQSLKEIEGKLTENNRKWKWYDVDEKTDNTKSEIYIFHSNHKVDIIEGKKKQTKNWKIQMDPDGLDNIIQIGDSKYTISFPNKNEREVLKLRSQARNKTTSTYDNYYSAE